MPTKNPRINITFDQDWAELIADLAERENKSVSSFAKELILDSLDRREDMALSKLAELRDKEGVKRIKDSDDIWN